MKTITKSIFFRGTLLSSLFLSAAQASGVLIVGNGDFEDDLAGIQDTDTSFTQADAVNTWFYDQGDTWIWTYETDGGPTGAEDAFAEGPGQTSYDKLLIQAVQDAPGTKFTGVYELSFQYNRPIATGDFAVIVWGYNDGDPNFTIPTVGALNNSSNYGGAINLGTQSYGVTTGWQSDSFSFDLGVTGYDTVIIGFRSDNTADLGIDNVSIIPEPSTFALVGLAGLASLFFRRRA
ncbi:MAG: PEP-CTERM sorting domain-containing protein [Kiritimatiellia bacterium]